MRVLFAAFVTAVMALPAMAELRLPAVFGDHMVVQQKKPVRVWGWSDPGAEVKVRIGSRTASATADDAGKWTAEVPAVPAGGPYTMNIRGGGETVVIRDVLCGEVWICSGQSNMEWPIDRSRDPLPTIAAANDPHLRYIDVPKLTSDTPQTDFEGAWQIMSSETAPKASAVAYFFAKRLREELGVPVGLLDTNWGGTPSESWTSLETLTGLEVFSQTMANWETALAEYPAKQAEYETALAAWEKAAEEAKAAGAAAPARPAAPRGPEHPHRPASLFNAMVAPLVPYSVQGAIWYQGESNAPRAYQYRTIFPAMIEDWRRHWDDEFSFYFVQLANFKARLDAPADSDWAELREAQSLALALPKTGQAVIIDIGEAEDIHPRNKQDVGARLAALALAKDYGKEVVPSGPVYASHAVEGGAIRLTFSELGGGLVCPEAALTGFAVAGEDKQFVWAQAVIDGDTVVVSAPEVAAPVAVRYAWADNPACNLYNRAGLPASPFRTDDWPGVTVDAR